LMSSCRVISASPLPLQIHINTSVAVSKHLAGSPDRTLRPVRGVKKAATAGGC
jgi:hypothetical protein